MTKAKHEWRKKEKELYLPKTKPEIIDVPCFKFISIEGEGNPNSQPFASCVSALYGVSYAIKMGLKKEIDVPENYQDYTVYPLEGIYDLNERAKQAYDGTFNKEDLVYKLMIRQPDFVDQVVFQQAVDKAKSKGDNEDLDRLVLENLTEGPSIQMLHEGSFDDEPATFEIIEKFAAENNLKRKSKKHREIYLSDFRKVPAHKLKTVLRITIE